MMNRNLFIGVLMALTMVMVGCKPNEAPKIPTYLHLDKVEVVHNSNETSTWGEGWLTAEIDAVQIELWFEGEKATTRLGTFELPCTVPVVTDKRKIDKIQIYPFVKQNGISATHIAYPFYEYYVGTDLKVAPDSITNIGMKDETGAWTIKVPYRSKQYVDVKLFEAFEPQQMGIALDSLVSVVENGDARSGLGFGRATFKKDEENKTFYIEREFKESDPSSYMYVEMDYRCDAMLTVSMESSYAIGGNPSIEGVMTLYATDDEWHKIYINLGRVWKYFNYNPKFKLCFAILNTEGIDGHVDIDNLKVLSI